jgi:hypothetical protein
MLAMVIKNMPRSLKDQLLTNVMCIFAEEFKFTDSLEEGINNTFLCAHYTWYNRFSKQVRYFE